jgi:hypothetical protein
MSKHFIALRLRPLKKWSDVAAATEHGQRIRNVPHVDLSRSHLNVHWVHDANAGCLVRTDAPADISACLRRRANQIGARWHKTAIVGTEVMFIASPDFFQRSDGGCEATQTRSSVCAHTHAADYAEVIPSHGPTRMSRAAQGFACPCSNLGPGQSDKFAGCPVEISDGDSTRFGTSKMIGENLTDTGPIRISDSNPDVEPSGPDDCGINDRQIIRRREQNQTRDRGCTRMRVMRNS